MANPAGQDQPSAAAKARSKNNTKRTSSQPANVSNTSSTKDLLFIEIGAFAGFEMYEEQGGCPAGGTVAGIGYISGRQCVILANDQTVKAGAWFPITGKKNLRLQEIAMENNLPVIYLVDSAGVFLPMQDEIFPDKEHFGRIFRNNARMSAMGITQIAVVLGPCVAGGAYLPIMSDETLMVEGNGSIFLAGPYLVKAAIGEQIDAETLGGAVTHTEISGIADYKFADRTEMLRPGQKDHEQTGPSTRNNLRPCHPDSPEASRRRNLRPLPRRRHPALRHDRDHSPHRRRFRIRGI